ncbi:hypothetical protein GALL_375720 [mine drainage metagenome]|uniref:DUF6036 domain-containing protein n=1 Tax=mine drainage metagenome TaxID=410659 RepID=A0A1J5QT69_9ZZZZ
MVEKAKGSFKTFTEAIFALLGNFGNQLTQRGATEHSVHIHIFGGCAVHLHTATRMSSDLDLEIHQTVLSAKELRQSKEETGFVLIQKTEDSEPDLLEIDLNFNSAIGPLHEDFDRRSRVLECTPGSPLVVLLPSREDLALTKLGRFSETDISDILALMSSPDASWDLLERLTSETDTYYPGPRGSLTKKLGFVINYRRGE